MFSGIKQLGLTVAAPVQQDHVVLSGESDALMGQIAELDATSAQLEILRVAVSAGADPKKLLQTSVGAHLSQLVGTTEGLEAAPNFAQEVQNLISEAEGLTYRKYLSAMTILGDNHDLIGVYEALQEVDAADSDTKKASRSSIVKKVLKIVGLCVAILGVGAFGVLKVKRAIHRSRPASGSTTASSHHQDQEIIPPGSDSHSESDHTANVLRDLHQSINEQSAKVRRELEESRIKREAAEVERVRRSRPVDGTHSPQTLRWVETYMTSVSMAQQTVSHALTTLSTEVNLKELMGTSAEATFTRVEKVLDQTVNTLGETLTHLREHTRKLPNTHATQGEVDSGEYQSAVAKAEEARKKLLEHSNKAMRVIGEITAENVKKGYLTESLTRSIAAIKEHTTAILHDNN